MNSILITGASSGLGAALARCYAQPNRRLALWGRDEGRLNITAAECRKRGATVDICLLDLRNISLVVKELREADRRSPIALAIFNAGVGGEAPAGCLTDPPDRVDEIATVNFTTVAVGSTTIGELMAGRGRGRIAIIGSIAEAFPLPMGPTYAGSKAGIALFAEALDLRLRSLGVTVTLVTLGFVDTPMSRQLSTPTPFLMSADSAASIIAREVAKKSRRVTIPRRMALLRMISRCLPRAVTRWVLRQF